MPDCGGEREWFALTCQYQHEKKTASHLRDQGWEEFLPLRRSARRWSDRCKTLDLPLFAGYVFCRFPLEYRISVLRTPGVISIVGFGHKPAAVSNQEIENLKALAISTLPVESWPYLRTGEQVRIRGGPLDGLEGLWVRAEDGNRVVVSVELLQRSVAVEIHGSWITPAGG